MPTHNTRLSQALLPDGFSVKIITPTDTNKKKVLDDIGKLQYVVWKDKGMDMSCVSSNIIDDTWLDDFDRNSYMWALYKEKKLVASARLTVHDSITSLPDASCYTGYQDCFPPPIISFNRLVVSKEFRQLKLSNYLEIVRIKKSIEIGAKSIALICPDYRVDSILKKEFTVLGQSDDDPHYPGIKWIIMRKTL